MRRAAASAPDVQSRHQGDRHGGERKTKAPLAILHLAHLAHPSRCRLDQFTLPKNTQCPKKSHLIQ
jgi:hypothetical protein